MGHVVAIGRRPLQSVEGGADRAELFGKIETRIARLGDFFDLSPGTRTEGLQNAKRVLGQAHLARIDGVIIKVRERVAFKRYTAYGNVLNAFIAKLGANYKGQVANGLKAGTVETVRTERSADFVEKLALQQNGDLLCIPVMWEKHVIEVKAGRLGGSEMPLGSFELLCEMIGNPSRLTDGVYLAEGDVVVHNGKECMPSFTVNGKVVIEPVRIGSMTKPAYRRLRGVMPA